MKTYSIGEVANLTGISVSTLRYYDKEGLLDHIKRSEGGIRIFTDEDLSRLNLIEFLKQTGMQLQDIRTFFEWSKLGDSTLKLRYDMLLAQKNIIEAQITNLKGTLTLLNLKCDYYKTAMDTVERKTK